LAPRFHTPTANKKIQRGYPGPTIPLTPLPAMLTMATRSLVPTQQKFSAQGGVMLSQIPADLSKLSKENLNQELLRIGIIAELDAINLYEQLAALTDDADIKKVFLDIAQEEKTHVGEFQIMLLRMDQQQVKEMEKAKEEIKELTGK